MDALLIKDLKKTYNGRIIVEALKGINLEIKKGEFFALLGPNGAGKTTTINILSSLTRKTSGEAVINGHDVEKDYQNARKSIGLVPQEFNLDIFSTVEETLIHQAGYFGINKKEAEKRMKTILKDLGIAEKQKAIIRELSGGMKRRVMIARALMHDPEILILDEPTAGVDVELRKALWAYTTKINKEGKTILLTTHYIEEAQALCQRAAIINKGQIIALDTIKNLLTKYNSEKLEDVFVQLTMGDNK